MSIFKKNIDLLNVDIMRYTVILSFLIFCCFLVGLSGSRVTNLSVNADGRDIIISWEMLDQNGVQHFNIERRTADQENFIRINNQPVTRNTNRNYEYVDRGVFKQGTAVVSYKVAIVQMDGSVHYTDEISLSNISSVPYRTWGSIKSMFR